MNGHACGATTARPGLAVGLLCAALLVACGGGDPVSADGETSTAREAAQAATTSLAVALPAEPDPMFDGLVIPADAPTRGMWSATQPWPMLGLHAAVLPNGKVMTYGTQLGAPDVQSGRTYDIWTPSLGFGAGSHQTTIDPARLDSFCSTSAFISDGRLMITGGNSARQSSLVAPATGTITTDLLMLSDQRWYGTLVTLPDSRNLMLGGMDPYNEAMQENPDAAVANGLISMTPEIYTGGTGWRSLTGARSREAFGPDYLRGSYPRAWVAPDGRVFGISAETMWSLDVNANGGTGAIQVHGRFKTPFSSTAPVNVGATSSAVMFAPGRILQVGGNGAFVGDDLPASDMATVVDITGAAPIVSETARMSFPRRYPNVVVLPDGKVVATGGTRRSNNGGADAVYAAEIWNPATGTWTVGASAAQIRVYHSVTVLLANGTVLSTGGGSPGPVDNLNAEIYFPPSLFRTVNGTAQLAPRPVLTGINSKTFAHGSALQLELRDATAISRLVLIANGLGTHSFNPGQRRVEVPFTQSGDRLTATMPASANLAPPGYYQLYALDAAGVPSRAVIVDLGLGTAFPPLAGVPRGQPLTLGSVSASGRSVGLDANQQAQVKVLGAADLAGAQYTLRNGLSDASCVSLESVAQPGYWLRHDAWQLRLSPNTGTSGFRDDATFCPEAGSVPGSVRLRSENVPTRILRVRADGSVHIELDDGTAAFRAESSFLPTLVSASVPPPTPGPVGNAPALAGSTVRWTPGLDAAGLSFSWRFGDGSPETAFSASSAASYTYASPGVYGVTLTVRNSAGATSSRTFMQAVYSAPTALRPGLSSPMLLEPRPSASARLWVVNPDNDSVSVFDTATRAKLAEIAVGASPRAIARAPGGAVWVVNRDAASISILNAGSLAVSSTVPLPRASQPHGLVFSPDGSAAWLALEARGQVARLNPLTAATVSLHDAGPTPRQLSISADSRRLLVSRFITGALPGEGTASVSTTVGGVPVGGEVRAFDTASMASPTTVVLRHSDRTDTSISGSGIPNYLGAAAISPDGRYAWVPSKQDNVRRGSLRNALNLDFQNTVRAVSSRIELATLAEAPTLRVDHDNASLASAAAYDPTGAYLFVALETSRQVEVLDAARGLVLFRIDTGLAPQGLVVSDDGRTLYVHNFMARSVSVVDLSALMTRGELLASTAATLSSVASDKLTANVLRGKQLFYDARDPRLARDSYLSCATCHQDGGHDGRTWDFTGFGEGLRNTIALRGRAGTGHGVLHWTANFDEVQDFEGQIRTLAGGTGLMSDALFNSGTRSTPLGDRKAGQSADLDALAAYVASLDQFAAAPARSADGGLTAAALAGRAVFQSAGCTDCHAGTAFTGSAGAVALKNIGTLTPASGQRLGAVLDGLDVPTLRDVWATAPYLHDGSAATLAAAVQAHRGNAVAGTDLSNLVAYLAQIGAEEPGLQPTSSGPPAAAIACASERQTCSLPAGVTATVWFGVADSWVSRAGVSGSIVCASWIFADPLPGAAKSCRYLADSAANVLPTVALTAPAAGSSFVAGTASITVSANAADTDGSIARVDFYDGTTLIGSDASAPHSIAWANPAAGTHTLTARAIDDRGGSTTSAAVAITVNLPATSPPAGAVACAAERQTCTLPAGVTATVWFGAAESWVSRAGVSGSIVCANWIFGDPLPGSAKSCRYLAETAANVLPTVALSAPAAGSSFISGAVAITVSANAADTDGNIARVDFYDGATLIGTDSAAPYSITWSGAAAGAHTLTARALDDRGGTTTSAAVSISVSPLSASPPAGAIACASERQTCTLPAGVTATVWFGAADSWISRSGVSGSITCANWIFGDPLPGTAKACRYAGS